MNETAQRLPEQAVAITIPGLQIQYLEIVLKGDSPLVCNAWDEKAKQAILDKQMGKATPKKEKKNPKKALESTLYKLKGGHCGFPAIAFKLAAVSGCRNVDWMSMSMARGAFHVEGEFVRIEGKPSMRSDMVRVGPQKSADVRFRAEFKEWKVRLRIRYNASVITPEQITYLYQVAGFAVGVGEGRPEKGRSWGMWSVE